MPSCWRGVACGPVSTFVQDVRINQTHDSSSRRLHTLSMPSFCRAPFEDAACRIRHTPQRPIGLLSTHSARSTLFTAIRAATANEHSHVSRLAAIFKTCRPENQTLVVTGTHSTEGTECSQDMCAGRTLIALQCCTKRRCFSVTQLAPGEV